MNITPIQLAKRVERWQKILSPLGVAHWEIHRVTLTDSVYDGGRAAASVSYHYDSVDFEFRNDWVEDVDAATLDVTIVHEWLHVAFRDMDSAMEPVEKWMPDSTWDDWRDRYKHEEEGLVQRLAVLIVLLHTGRTPRFAP